MKSLLRASLTAVAVYFLSFIAFVPLANAEDVSIGITGGRSTPRMNCNGCPSFGVSDQNQYGIDWRILVQITDVLKFGTEVGITASPSADVKANGIKVGSVTSQRLSFTPMFGASIGDLTAYLGVGVTMNYFTFKDTPGASVSNNGNAGWLAK